MIAVVATALAATSLPAKTTYVPITYRNTSGIRPFVRVMMNGKPFLMMIHANAGFDAMITHAGAKRAGIKNLVRKGDFGITAVGEKSSLALSTATVATFDVAHSVIRDMPIQIFEIPQKSFDGMAGIGWLRKARVIIDYHRNRLALPATKADAAQEQRRLIAEGYTAVPMIWDAANYRYLVHPELNDTPATFVVSTVSRVVIDDQFARARNIALSAPVDTFGGPTGATGEERDTTDRYTLSLAGKSFTAPTARVYDIYAYDGEPRPQDPASLVSGYLGADFMLANDAVIDFGSGTLYVRQAKRH